MPRQVAPPPSAEFTVRLTKPFTGKVDVSKNPYHRKIPLKFMSCTGTPNHVVEVIGEPNRSASVNRTQQTGGSTSIKKTGSVSKYVKLHSAQA